MKSGNLNFLGPYGPLQACNGTDFTYIYIDTKSKNHCIYVKFQSVLSVFYNKSISENAVGYYGIVQMLYAPSTLTSR